MNYFSVFITSMLPISELRGAIPLGLLLGINLIESAVIAIVGNIILCFLLMFLLRPIIRLLSKISLFNSFMEYLQRRTIKKSLKVKKLSLFGLYILVAIPLPGTGVYTGAMVATFLDIRYKHAIPVMGLGVLTSGIIVSLLLSFHVM